MTAVTQSPLAVRLESVEVCVLCGSGRATFLHETRDRLLRLPGVFGLVRCDECGLVRLSPRPRQAEIGAYYPSDYECYDFEGTEAGEASGDHERAAESSPGIRTTSRIKRFVRTSVLDAAGYPGVEASVAHRLARPLTRPFRRRVFYRFRGFPQWHGEGRALDVGCSTGGFLWCLKQYGWDVAGVELNESAASQAAEAVGCDVFAGEVGDAPFPEASFDFVHMSHVIEHVYDPVATLQAVRRLLRPGGLLYVETPNARGSGAVQCGSYWFPWESPRHIHLFNPETLEAALTQAGLTRGRMKTWPVRGLGLYAFEDTFRREERTGRVLDPRWHLERRHVLRALARFIGTRWRRVVDPLSADILGCWARRPEHDELRDRDGGEGGAP